MGALKNLLTGGAGYIGSYTVVVLAETGLEIVFYDNLCNSKGAGFSCRETITGTRFSFVEGDVRDTALLVQTLWDHSINAVIHFADLKAFGESVKKPIEYYENNVVGTVSLLKAMRTVGVKALVFSSSATIYGDPQYFCRLMRSTLSARLTLMAVASCRLTKFFGMLRRPIRCRLTSLGALSA